MNETLRELREALGTSVDPNQRELRARVLTKTKSKNGR